MKDIDKEQVQSGIENQGFQYYMENYASGDLKDTVVWPQVEGHSRRLPVILSGPYVPQVLNSMAEDSWIRNAAGIYAPPDDRGEAHREGRVRS